MAVKPIPDGYHTVTPYLVVEGAEKLLSFLKDAFGAEETVRMPGPDGKIGHAEVRIGDSMVMMADAAPEWPRTSTMIHLYLDGCDAAYQRAISAGATSEHEPKNEFYGDRSAGVRDAFGNHWYIATHVEDIPPEEMPERAKAAGFA